MDEKDFDRLAKLGALEDMPSGGKGVRVSLQYQPNLTLRARAERRQELCRRFEDIDRHIGPLGACIDLDSLSLSAQTVEALLPVEKVEEIERVLREDKVRTALVERVQVVD